MKTLEYLLSLIFIVIIIYISLYIYRYFCKYISREYIISSIDDKKYLVGKGENSLESANLLSELNSKMNSLIKKINIDRENGWDKNFYNNIKLLVSRFRPDTITENIFTSEATAYTVNKGEEISFCLKTKDKKMIYDINTLVFVAIHELAHIGSESIGHTKEFVDFFVFLLKKAMSSNIYTFVDYSKYPVNYCGIIINETPVVF